MGATAVTIAKPANLSAPMIPTFLYDIRDFHPRRAAVRRLR
jgi:hypothetical protein